MVIISPDHKAGYFFSGGGWSTFGGGAITKTRESEDPLKNVGTGTWTIRLPFESWPSFLKGDI